MHLMQKKDKGQQKRCCLFFSHAHLLQFISKHVIFKVEKVINIIVFLIFIFSRSVALDLRDVDTKSAVSKRDDLKTNAIEEENEQHERKGFSGSSLVSVRVSHKDNSVKSVGYTVDAVYVSIVHFRPLEKVLGGNWTDHYNHRNYRLNSSVITASIEVDVGDDDRHKDLDVNDEFDATVTVRFFDFRFPDNESHFSDLTCARLNVIKSKKGDEAVPEWRFLDNDCRRLWHPEGITCECDGPGTFALIKWTRFGNSVSASSVGRSSFSATRRR